MVNAFGGAEILEGNLAFGTKTRRAFQLRLEAPLVAIDHSLRTRGEVSAFGLQRDNTSFASSVQDINGIKVALRVSATESIALQRLLTQRANRHHGGKDLMSSPTS